MKKYIKILFITVVCMTLGACSDNDDPNFPVPSPFSVAFEAGNTIDAAGGTLNLKITAGTNGWWIETSSGSSWCTVDRMFGSGDRVLTVRATANNTGDDRQAVITISPTFDLPSQTITIFQEK